jgi:hypothetical protein
MYSRLLLGMLGQSKTSRTEMANELWRGSGPARQHITAVLYQTQLRPPARCRVRPSNILRDVVPATARPDGSVGE